MAEERKIKAKYSLDHLSMNETREHRRLIRELSGDPEVTALDASGIDYYTALVYLIERRDNPDFTLEQAGELKWDDIHEPSKRPTRAAPKS